MKIALIADSIKSKTGGPSVILKETKIALQKKGIDVKIISNDELKKTKVSLNNSMNGIDICHLYGGWTYFHVKCFFTARNLKKKIIIHPLGYYEPWSLKEKKFKKIIAWYGYQKKIIEAANLIHCASKQEEKNLLELKASFNTIVIPYGIKDSFIKKKITKKKIKKKAIFFSRIHKKKGIENLLTIWKEIDNKHWQLDICGPVNNIKYLQKLMFNFRNYKNINFLNPIYDLKKKISLFEKYDFMILPSYSENFGFVVLEALARGLPVLTTTSTPWKEIKKKNSGWVVRSSCLQLSRTIKKIFQQSEINKNYFFIKSKNAIKLAKKYSWKNISSLYIDTYRKLLNE